MTQSFDVFFDLRLYKRLNKKSWGWRFETPSCSLCHHCNAFLYLHRYILFKIRLITYAWYRNTSYYLDYSCTLRVRSISGTCKVSTQRKTRGLFCTIIILLSVAFGLIYTFMYTIYLNIFEYVYITVGKFWTSCIITTFRYSWFLVYGIKILEIFPFFWVFFFTFWWFTVFNVIITSYDIGRYFFRYYRLSLCDGTPPVTGGPPNKGQ